MSFLDNIKKKIEDKVAPLREFFDKDNADNYQYDNIISTHMDTVEEFKSDVAEMEKAHEYKYTDPFAEEELKQKEE